MDVHAATGERLELQVRTLVEAQVALGVERLGQGHRVDDRVAGSAAEVGGGGVRGVADDDVPAADVRRARSHLSALASAGEQAAEQSDIDQVFGVRAEHGTTPLPKGLNRQTGDLVLAALADGELSATECAEQLGLSRVTARRYLEHFVETGAATARQQYGRVGRPERRYALRAG